MIKVPELERRRIATDKTLKKYRGKEFDWAKEVTCVHLARFHMRCMGHKPRSIPRFRSLLGAKKTLLKLGWNNTVEMFDSMLPRIKPSEMILGDIAVLADTLDENGKPAVDIGAIVVCAGPRKVIGWREDAPQLVVLDVSLDEMVGAWRV